MAEEKRFTDIEWGGNRVVLMPRLAEFIVAIPKHLRSVAMDDLGALLGNQSIMACYFLSSGLFVVFPLDLELEIVQWRIDDVMDTIAAKYGFDKPAAAMVDNTPEDNILEATFEESKEVFIEELEKLGVSFSPEELVGEPVEKILSLPFFDTIVAVVASLTLANSGTEDEVIEVVRSFVKNAAPLGVAYVKPIDLEIDEIDGELKFFTTWERTVEGERKTVKELEDLFTPVCSDLATLVDFSRDFIELTLGRPLDESVFYPKEEK